MTIKNKFIALILIMFCSLSSMAQVGVGTNSPNANAALDITSTTQGMLFPRLTTAQRDAIGSPAKGLTIFNTTLDCIQTNIGTTTVPVWKCLAATNDTTKGTAVISAYDCNIASTGTLLVGTAVSGVTQTIKATVITGGTYNISTNTVNGITFSASGSFVGTGDQQIVLTATGTPTAKGSNTFTLTTAPNCSFDRYASITGYYANVGGTIKDFAKSNLGADTSLNAFTYVQGNADGSGGTLGYLYQWGRQTDGHELRNSEKVSGPQNAAIAGKFIIPTAITPNDWISPQNDYLWGDGTTTTLSPAKAVDDPCPVGFKIPSQNQWNRLYRDGTPSGLSADATYNTWTWTGKGYMLKPSNTNGDYTLYLPAAGYRRWQEGNLMHVGSIGYYWSSGKSSLTATAGSYMYISTNGGGSNAEIYPNGQALRGNGFSIRCIAVDSPSTNGEAVVSSYVSKSFTGTMTAGVAVSNVTQTITADVATVGTYGIAATANGVTFGYYGTFTITGAQDIVLTAKGTPTTNGNNSFTLNTTPNCSFSRTTN